MPIKRDENIAPLSREHHHGLLFCWKIRQGKKHNIDLERIGKYINYFWKHELSGHFKKEETILFYLLRDGISNEGYYQHKELEKQFSIFLREGYCWQDCLDLADLLEQHIRYEERILFPHFEQALSAEQLDQIGKALVGFEIPGEDDGYQDEFWKDSDIKLD